VSLGAIFFSLFRSTHTRFQNNNNNKISRLEYSAPESLPFLHKYFKGNRFESRYVEFGDADGDEPIRREEEFEKMERLEKRVLDYPGLVFFSFLFSKKTLDYLGL
jgi:hypothetical protein